MATSGTFTASRGSNLNLILDWSRVETDIANNRSKIRLTLKLQHTGYGVYFSSSKSGSLHGEGFTYTGGFSGSGTRTLRTRDVWINHNSDGSKSQSFSASINLNINYENSYLGTFSVSGTAYIDTIPRASTITSFSMNKNLQTTTGNSINLGISRNSSSFTHDIQLRIGSTVIASWNGQGLPTSLSVSASQVNDLMNRIQTSDRATITLRVQTKNGSTNIGSAVTRNSTVWIDGSVVPVISGLRVWINSGAGGGRDVAINKYVQSISKASAEFSPSARGYAYLVSNRIYIRKVGGANSTTIHASSGTSAVLTSNGTYEVIAETTDSRGRTTTERTTFNVEAYSPPRISSFSADRLSATPTTVNVTRAGSHSALGGSNLLTIVVQRRPIDGAWVTIDTSTTSGSNSSFNAIVVSTGNVVTQSYEFKVIVTDQLGNIAESIITVPTSFVLLDIHQDLGVGIGKMHEQGVLDVGGDAYFNGSIVALGGFQSNKLPPNTDLNNVMATGFYYNNSSAEAGTMLNVPFNRAFSLLVERHAGWKQTFTNYETVRPYTWIRNFYDGSWGDWEQVWHGTNGDNSNGHWVRFPEGTQICYTTAVFNRTTNECYVTLGADFKDTNFTVSLSTDSGSWAQIEDVAILGVGITGVRGIRIMVYDRGKTPFRSTSSLPLNVMAIGAWK